MSAGQSCQPAVKAPDETVGVRIIAHRLMGNRLSNRERVLDAVLQLAQEQTLVLIPGSSFGDVAGTFKHKSTTVKGFELHLSLDDQHPSILRAVNKLSGPAPFFVQLLHQSFERRAGHVRFEELLLASAYRLIAGVPIQLLAAVIPFEDTSLKFPYENRLLRQFHQALLVVQL